MDRTRRDGRAEDRRAPCSSSPEPFRRCSRDPGARAERRRRDREWSSRLDAESEQSVLVVPVTPEIDELARGTAQHELSTTPLPSGVGLVDQDVEPEFALRRKRQLDCYLVAIARLLPS